MATSAPKVRVGVAVFVLASKNEDRENPRFLVGRRKGSHGAGTMALPGGHLEFGEETEECAARELLEETGLKVTDIRFLTATNDYMPEDNKHYITLFHVCVREMTAKSLSCWSQINASRGTGLLGKICWGGFTLRKTRAPKTTT